MEILIIGVAVVALMAYVSTRIKKSAAAAFAEEKIDTDDFSLIKPEDFLSPVENEEFLAFYAYSRDFGEDDGVEKLRQALIKVRKLGGQKLADIRREKRSSMASVKREEDTDGGFVLVGERDEKGIDKLVTYRFVTRGEDLFELEFVVLADYQEKYAAAAAKLLNGFLVKS